MGKGTLALPGKSTDNPNKLRTHRRVVTIYRARVESSWVARGQREAWVIAIFHQGKSQKKAKFVLSTATNVDVN